MTTNVYLYEMLYGLPGFLGVFSSDTISSVGQSSADLTYIICNLSPSTEPGSHWICIIESQFRVFYFDSFGRDCHNEDIARYIRLRKKNVYYSPIEIQDILSDKCGFFCLSLILHLHCRKSIKKFLTSFSNNLEENDTIVIRLIRQSCDYLTRNENQ